MFKECQKFLNRNLPSQEFGRTKVWPLWARTGISFRKKLQPIISLDPFLCIKLNPFVQIIFQSEVQQEIFKYILSGKNTKFVFKYQMEI